MNTRAAELPFSVQMRMRLGRTLLSLVSSQVLGAALSMGVVALSTRLLGTEGYGDYSLFLMAASFFSVLGVNWVFNGIYKAAADDRTSGSHMGRALGTGGAILGVLILVQSLLVVGLERWIGPWIGLTGPRLLILPGYVAVLSFVTIGHYTLQALGEFERFALLPNFERLLFLSVLFFMWKSSDHIETQSILVLLFCTQTVLAFAVFSQLDWARIGRLTVSGEELRRILQFSYPYILTNVALFGANWIDVYVVEHFMDRSQVGVFYLAVQFQTLATTIIFVMNTVLTQMFVALTNEGREEAIQRFYQNRAPLLLTAFIPFLMTGTWILRGLFPIVFKSSFEPALPLMLVLTMSLLAAVVYVLFHPLLFARGKTFSITLFNFLPLLVTVPLAFQFVPQFGLFGASWIRVAGSILTSAVLFGLVRGRDTGPIRKMIFLFIVGEGLLAINAISGSAVVQCAALAVSLGLTAIVWRAVRAK